MPALRTRSGWIASFWMLMKQLQFIDDKKKCSSGGKYAGTFIAQRPTRMVV
ncbi:hypothetical protein GDO78_006423 [Eleutherodactylus coqui]|uniref:Uncharacterized protein n=1 Tax=Eleutherodactylus coqui TaxID=57060 RepID=A0A8J6FQT5_ELECQ|nr:hypothetical protein GDO78_006423 [Eleutherodactylus coqui]